MQNHAYPDPTREKLVDAALSHVIFDGWGPETFERAVNDSGVSPQLARICAPRGAADLAAAYHKRADRQLVEALSAADFGETRLRDKIAQAIWLRLESVDREVVRRGMSFYALPHHAPDGTRLLWETADVIWTALGDTSRDVSWYTKRATLSGVFASTVLFWLGDDSEDFADTKAFIDRRIEDVMQIEKAKSTVRNNTFLSAVFACPNAILSRINAPAGVQRDDVPGTQSKT